MKMWSTRTPTSKKGMGASPKSIKSRIANNIKRNSSLNQLSAPYTSSSSTTSSQQASVPDCLYLLSVVEYHHQYHRGMNGSGNLGNNSYSNGGFSLIDDGTIETTGYVAPSFRTLGIFEKKQDTVLQLPNFKTQTCDMNFPHQHADPGTLYRRHRIKINIDNRDNIPDHGIILELEYLDGDDMDMSVTKRRDQVCIAKIPYFPHVPINTDEKDMVNVNIIRLK